MNVHSRLLHSDVHALQVYASLCTRRIREQTDDLSLPLAQFARECVALNIPPQRKRTNRLQDSTIHKQKINMRALKCTFVKATKMMLRLQCHYQ